MGWLEDQEAAAHMNIGQPIQQGVQGVAQGIDNGVDAMRLAAMQKLSSNPQGAQAMTPPPNPMLGGGQAGPAPKDMGIPEVLPNDPSMSAADATTRMRAMIDAPMAMKNAAAKLRAQAALDQEHENHVNSLDSEDMSGYRDVPTSAQREAASQAPPRFQNLQHKINTKQVINKDDIRDHLKGLTEVTPELEKQLGYGSDEEEEQK